MGEQAGTTITPSDQGRAIEHCDNYVDRKYRRIALLGVEDGLPRQGCEIARKTVDHATLDERKDAAPAGARRPDDREPPPVVATTDATLIQQLADGTKRRLFITGEGGLGKTEYTRLIALRLAERFLDRPDVAVVPVRVELGSLEADEKCGSVDALLANHLARDEQGWIEPYLTAGRVAFVLDGLDELTLPATVFYAALGNAIVRHHRCTFVLAGRPGSLPAGLAGGGPSQDGASRDGLFGPAARHELQPLTDADVRRYVAGFFAHEVPARHGELTAGLLAAIAAGRSSLRPLIYTPFMLSLACTVYREDRRLPANPAELFDLGVRELWRTRRDRQPSLPSDALCFEVLSTLAAYAVAAPAPENRVRLKFGRVEARNWIRTDADHYAAINEPLPNEPAIDAVLKRLAPGSGLLVEAGSDYLFTNRVAAEFLAARWICRHGYPEWPHEHDPYTPRPDGRGVDPATAARDQQIMDWLGDQAWSEQRAALVQAVRFELANAGAVAPGRTPLKAGIRLARQAARWLDDTIARLVGENDGPWSRMAVLVQGLFHTLQALEGVGDDGAALEELKGIARSRLRLPDRWWLNESDVELVSLLPACIGITYCRAAVAEMRRGRSAPVAERSIWESVHSPGAGLASAFAGNVTARDAVVRSLRAARAKPHENEPVIVNLARALARGFADDPVSCRALAGALRVARADPIRNEPAIRNLSQALAEGFDGHAVARDALIRTLRVARTDPAAYRSVIHATSGALASGFGGDPAARAALVRALRAARADPKRNGSVIADLCQALAAGFRGDPVARTALTRSLRTFYMWDWYDFDRVTRALADAFPGDPAVRRAVIRALRVARDELNGFSNPIGSLAIALATGFRGDPTARNALVRLMNASRANLRRDAAAVGAVAGPLAAGFAHDPIARRAMLRALRAAQRPLDLSAFTTADVGLAILKLVSALGEGFGGDYAVRRTLLRTFRRTRAATPPDVFRLGCVARALSAGFAGDPVVRDELVGVLRSALRQDHSAYMVVDALATGFSGDAIVRDLMADLLLVSHELRPDVTSSVARGLAGQFGGDTVARRALVTALMSSRSTEKSSNVASIADALAAGFRQDAVARDALCHALHVSYKGASIVDGNAHNYASALATGFPGDAVARRAMVRAIESSRQISTQSGHGAGALTRALVVGFAGDPVAAAANFHDQGHASRFDSDGWHRFVVLRGPWGELVDLAGLNGAAWGLSGEVPVVQLINPVGPAGVGADRPAVLVAPREQIRRGLPAVLLRRGYADVADLNRLPWWLDELAKTRGVGPNNDAWKVGPYLQALLYLREALPARRPSEPARAVCRSRAVRGPQGDVRPSVDELDPSIFDLVTDEDGPPRDKDAGKVIVVGDECVWPYRWAFGKDVHSYGPDRRPLAERISSESTLKHVHACLRRPELIGATFSPRLTTALENLFAHLGIERRGAGRKKGQKPTDVRSASSAAEDRPSNGRRGE